MSLASPPPCGTAPGHRGRWWSPPGDLVALPDPPGDLLALPELGHGATIPTRPPLPPPLAWDPKILGSSPLGPAVPSCQATSVVWAKFEQGSLEGRRWRSTPPTHPLWPSESQGELPKKQLCSGADHTDVTSWERGL